MPLTETQKLALEVESLKKKVDKSSSESITLLTDAIKDVAIHGKDGVDGNDGEDGEKGDKGEPGARGLRGLKGGQGEQGSRGLKGDQGIQGPKGDKGNKGDKGDPGPPGEQGKKGERGLRGLKGAKGSTPKHEIKDKKIRFEKPDGKWGKWINLGVEGGGTLVIPSLGDLSSTPVTTDDVIYGTDTQHLDTLQEFINHVWSAGSGSEPGEFNLTENGDGTVNITGGVFVLRSAESETATLMPYTIAGVTNLTLTDEATNYIQVDYNNGSPEITTSADLNDVTGVQTKTTMYAVNRLGTQLNIIDLRAFNVDFIRKNSLKDYKVHGFEHASGAFISDLGNRNITISASEFYLLNQSIQSASLDTSVTGVFEYVYRDGLGGWNRTPNQTQIDNLNYDDGSGTLAVVGNNKYYSHYVYIVLNNPSHYKVVYGQNTYNTLEEAEAEQVPSILPSDLDPLSTGVFIGKVIVQQAVDAFVTIQSPFTQILTSAVANNHANLAGLQGGKVGEYYHLSSDEKDQFVLYMAEKPNSTLSYTGELLTNIAYVDTTDIINNSKVLAYSSGLLETTTHTFDYLSQTWTVTTTLSYTAGKLTGKSTTIGKV